MSPHPWRRHCEGHPKGAATSQYLCYIERTQEGGVGSGIMCLIIAQLMEVGFKLAICKIEVGGPESSALCMAKIRWNIWNHVNSSSFHCLVIAISSSGCCGPIAPTKTSVQLLSVVCFIHLVYLSCHVNRTATSVAFTAYSSSFVAFMHFICMICEKNKNFHQSNV